MPSTLLNHKITLVIDHPEENYSGPRFDWSAKVVALKFKGKQVFGLEKRNTSRTADFGRAFYNEFGIDTALGFEAAEVGDWFHKIGVGLLKKTEPKYSFLNQYEIQPCQFLFKAAANSFDIRCKAPLINGYAYELKKEIQLVESGFVMAYELRNTGNKAIHTDEYCHNFIAIKNELIGEGYTLRFPFQLNTDAFGEYVNPDNTVVFLGKEIRFKDTPKSDLFFSNLSGGKEVKASWELYNSNQNIGIKETGSFRTNKINLWGCGHVISPELFFRIDLDPGKIIKWSRRYDLFEHIT